MGKESSKLNGNLCYCFVAGLLLIGCGNADAVPKEENAPAEVAQLVQGLRSDTKSACSGSLVATAYVDSDAENCYATVIAEDRREIIVGPVASAMVGGGACVTIGGGAQVCNGLTPLPGRYWFGQIAKQHGGQRCSVSATSHIELGGCSATAFAYDVKW